MDYSAMLTFTMNTIITNEIQGQKNMAYRMFLCLDMNNDSYEA